MSSSCGFIECKSEKNAASACGRCAKIRYCSVECQRLDWKVHKKFCAAFYSESSNLQVGSQKINETKKKSYATKSQRELIDLFNEYCKKALQGVMQKDHKHSHKYAIRAIDLEENYLKRGPRDLLANLCHSKMYRVLGEGYRDQKSLVDALENLAKAKELSDARSTFPDGECPVGEIQKFMLVERHNCVVSLADSYMHNAALERAEPYCEEAYRLGEIIKNYFRELASECVPVGELQRYYVQGLVSNAAFYMRIGQVERAIQFYQKAYDCVQSSTEMKVWARDEFITNFIEALVNGDASHLERAESMLNDKLVIMKAAGETEMKSSDELNYAKILETLALVMLRRGKATEAEMTSQSAVDLFGKFHCTFSGMSLQRALHTFAVARTRQDKLDDQTAQAYLSALNAYDAVSVPGLGFTRIASDFGYFFRRLGCVSRALILYENALEVNKGCGSGTGGFLPDSYLEEVIAELKAGRLPPDELREPQPYAEPQCPMHPSLQKTAADLKIKFDDLRAERSRLKQAAESAKNAVSVSAKRDEWGGGKPVVYIKRGQKGRR